MYLCVCVYFMMMMKIYKTEFDKNVIQFYSCNISSQTMTAIGSMISTIPTTTIILMLAMILLLTCLLGLMLDTQNIILNQTHRKLNELLAIVSKNWLMIRQTKCKTSNLNCEDVVSDVYTSNSLESVSYENKLLERQQQQQP